jgi:hypothetical protein
VALAARHDLDVVHGSTARAALRASNSEIAELAADAAIDHLSDPLVAPSIE